MSIAITTSPQLVQYFGTTKDISGLTNMDNVQEMVTIDENGNYQSGTPDFAGFTQFKQGDGYLIFSKSTAPETYTIDAADSAETRPSSTSVSAAIAIKLYVGGTVDLLDPANITNYESIYLIDDGGNYQSYLKSNVVDENGVRLTGANDKSNFNGFNTLEDSKTYLIFTDSSFSFDGGNTYPWATFTSGNSMYAICPEEDLVKVLDTSGHSVSSTIKVGDNPVDMVMVDHFIYVVNKFSQTISVIDTGTNTVVDTIFLFSGTGRGNYHFTFLPTFIDVFEDSGDQLLAVGSDSKNVILIVDIRTREIKETISLPSTASSISSMYLLNKTSSNDDRVIYVSNTSTNEVLRVEDKKSFSVIDSELTGFGTQSHYGQTVAISRNGQYLAVTTDDSQQVDGYKFTDGHWEFLGFYRDNRFADIRSLSVTDDGQIGIGWTKSYVVSTDRKENYGTLNVIQFIDQINEYVSVKPLVRQAQGSVNFSTSRFATDTDINKDGTRVIVGASNNQRIPQETFTGAAYVYDWNAATYVWDLVGGPIQDNIGGRFGASVAIDGDGDYIAVGDPDSRLFTPGGGLVKVYSLVNSEWALLGQIIPPLPGDTDTGKRVSISDNGPKIMVQSRKYVCVYEYDGASHYTMVGEPISIGRNAICSFGRDGNHIIVGDPSDESTTVYEYSSVNDSFIMVDETIRSAFYIDFGASVDVNKDGSTIVISAPKYGDANTPQGTRGSVAAYNYVK